MHRIDAEGATEANLFTDGDPAEQVPATVVDAAFLNALQEEIAAVIEGAGVTLVKGTKNQLYTVLQALVASGGGGGGSATWNPKDGYAPIQAEENGEKVFQFERGGDSRLVLWLKVPQGYVAGKQIKAYLGWYSPSTSNGVLFKTISYLVRKNLDAVTSTTNARTSTNTEVTNTVANQYREISVDITDASGQINGVAVAAGAAIRVELYRDVDTDTAAARFVPSLTEIKFG